ncbi:Thioredoxin C-1 [Pseudidiomarina piscicola]|uniref:Thioredoxin C-1 n=1 Tax=Pseudidiomarina piscicola TaxID=2614830 RepID=A0A6S6WLE7_9GAMM|nr:protein disulfide oxidoreductase [Pseudidiomarina piscicola]CAB0150779.1 Thioredoxin C-1 [Pseudidiomarina piscicola]VZT40282.1 Thioredoxin C-1 [Pseudomonas aeruginosa]
MIKKLLIYFMLALLVLTAMDIWRGQNLPKGQLLEDTWQTVRYEQVNLVEQSYEEPVIVYFWGSWCPVCHVISPTVDWLASYLPVVTVAMSSGTDAQVRNYLARNDYEFKVVNDPEARLSNQWGVPVTPAFAIVKDGEIHSFTAGATTPLGLYARWLWARF